LARHQDKEIEASYSLKYVFVLKRTDLRLQVTTIILVEYPVSRKYFVKISFGTLLWHSVLFQYLEDILVVLGGGY
jgi:hypothetical protein